MSLTKLRAKWEKGLKDCVVINTQFVSLAVLQDNDGLYSCHRYFTICGEWECSVDRQDVALDDVWQWLQDFGNL